MKKCSLCGALKALSEFGKNGPLIRSRCKKCRSTAQIEWQRENSEAHNARLRRYRRENPEKSSAPSRAYYQRNKKKKTEYNRRWRSENPELWKHICSLYNESHRAEANERKKRREAKQRMALPTWADKERIVAIYRRAEFITKSSGVPHEVDHIVPLVSPVVCGLHCEGNLRVVERSINRSKGNRLLEVSYV